jgi:hypothetical protein
MAIQDQPAVNDGACRRYPHTSGAILASGYGLKGHRLVRAAAKKFLVEQASMLKADKEPRAPTALPRRQLSGARPAGRRTGSSSRGSPSEGDPPPEAEPPGAASAASGDSRTDGCCAGCGEPLGPGRPNRRHHGPACRKLSYRARQAIARATQADFDLIKREALRLAKKGEITDAEAWELIFNPPAKILTRLASQREPVAA